MSKIYQVFSITMVNETICYQTYGQPFSASSERDAIDTVVKDDGFYIAVMLYDQDEELLNRTIYRSAQERINGDSHCSDPYEIYGLYH